MESGTVSSADMASDTAIEQIPQPASSVMVEDVKKPSLSIFESISVSVS